MSEKISLREIIAGILNEIKVVIKEYMNEAETAFKKRLKRMLIFSIVTTVLISLGISFAGTASLFVLIGSFFYLHQTMPTWEALYIMAITSAITAAALFFGLYIVIRKQLKSPEKTEDQK
jgi:hypothetical protein